MTARAARWPQVLVTRTDGLGDVLLAGPAVRAIARRSRVTMLVGPAGTAAAALLPGVDEVLTARLPWIDADPLPVARPMVDSLTARIAAAGVDEAVILTSFHQSPLPLALVLRLAGVPRVSAISVDYPGSLLDVRHSVPDDVHEVERNLSLAEAAGFPPGPDDDGALHIDHDGTVPPGLPDRFVVVHPGTSVPARAWDPERHRWLVALLATHRPVIVTGGPSEHALVRRVAGRAGIPLTDVDLPTLAAVFARADAVVAGNTGPAHLAASVGTPVVSLFAPTVPATRWRPWRVPHVLLGDQAAPCRGCRARVCPEPRHPCLDAVAPATVARALEELT